LDNRAPLAGLEKILIRMIGIDVDGTLVGSSGEVSPLVWEAAERVRRAGIRMVLCSGRPAFGVALEYARRLDPSGWHVFQNGASVVNLANDQSRSVSLPRRTVTDYIERARHGSDALELYSDRDYVTESESAWAHQHAKLLGVPYRRRAFDSLTGEVVRAQWLMSHTDAQAFESSTHDGLEIALSSSPLMADTTFVGVTRAGVNKGSAIVELAREYGLDMRDVMYVGDSENDLCALQKVGYPVAMQNASRAVLKAAKDVVPHVDEGGVANAMELALGGHR
jgi:Cof subfamily protein (haloacid dehalogenase superfamily)